MAGAPYGSSALQQRHPTLDQTSWKQTFRWSRVELQCHALEFQDSVKVFRMKVLTQLQYHLPGVTIPWTRIFTLLCTLYQVLFCSPGWSDLMGPQIHDSPDSCSRVMGSSEWRFDFPEPMIEEPSESFGAVPPPPTPPIPCSDEPFPDFYGQVTAAMLASVSFWV
ncbi:hypothetical protein STEG23_019277 [Scotinomys teguina]